MLPYAITHRVVLEVDCQRAERGTAEIATAIIFHGKVVEGLCQAAFLVPGESIWYLTAWADERIQSMVWRIFTLVGGG